MVHSASMQKQVEVLYIVPDKAIDGSSACPVLYLLHGYSDNAYKWLQVNPGLPRIAEEKGIIFVCPDGENSWYWDSPLNPAYRYETFVSTELVDYTDRHYSTIAHRKGRAITGLSMGGHGALWLSIRHQDVFGAAGSTSGGVDIRPFADNWEMKKQLGERSEHPERWDAHTVMTQLDKLTSGSLALTIDCGSEDFFLDVNRDLHRQLLGCNIPHDFSVRPGGHNNSYWRNALDHQLLFFEKFFRPELLKVLDEANCSCVVSNQGQVTKYSQSGVRDLYGLVTSQPEILRGAQMADKIIGKGAAALLVLGGVKQVNTHVITAPALKMLRKADVEVYYEEKIPYVINRKKTGQCPLDARLQQVDDARLCLPIIEQFIQDLDNGLIM